MQPQFLEDHGSIEPQILEVVARTGEETGAVAECVAHGGELGDGRILELKLGKQLVNRRLPAELAAALTDRGGDSGRGERLRYRGDLEHRIGRNLFPGADLAHPEPLSEDGLAAVHNGHGHPGYATLLERILRECWQPHECSIEQSLEVLG